MVLKRIAHDPEFGMFGSLILGSIPFAVTIELPWRNNERFVSCIPCGYYECKRIKRPNEQVTFEICNVPNRDHILFHIANNVKDLLGCIGVAEEFGELRGKPAVLSSGRGFAEFMNKLHGVDSYWLTIEDYVSFTKSG